MACGARKGGADDADAFAAEDLVKGAAVLAITVTDEQAGTVEWATEGEVARLLGNPGAGRVRSAAGEMDAAAFEFDEEEDVETA